MREKARMKTGWKPRVIGRIRMDGSAESGWKWRGGDGNQEQMHERERKRRPSPTSQKEGLCDLQPPEEPKRM
jgi:hypothetical protein